MEKSPAFDIASENSFDFLSDEYRALFESSRATVFQHPLWLDRLYRRLAPRRNAEPVIIAARRSDNGRLAMILPLVRRRYGVVRFIEFADLRVSDYAAPVCDDATFGLIARDHTACERIRSAMRPYDFLRMLKLRRDTLPLDRLLGIASRSSMGDRAYSVPLYGPFEKWRADKMDPSYRKALDTKARRIGRKGVLQLEVSGDPESITATFQRMRDFHLPRFQGRYRKDDLMQSPVYFDFYLDLAIAGAGAGLCRTYALSLDGRPIACLWGLTHRGRFLTILQGFDLKGYKNYSIGALKFEAVARDCIERGDTILDFTIGDEPYKRSFGAQPTAMWMASASRGSLGALVGFVTRQMPWTVEMAKRIANRKAFT
jgi:CelD/BcsL family acetyltransferase involved in cellulose biosynthesis